MNSNSTNPVLERWLKRTEKLNPVVREALASLSHTFPMAMKIKKTKSCKVAPKEGDLICLKTYRNTMVWGRVLDADLQSGDPEGFMEHKIVVVLYKNGDPRDTKLLHETLKENLMMAPIIVDMGYWHKGYFQTLDHMPLSPLEKELSYGFYDFRKEVIVDSQGCQLDLEPDFLGIYGVTTIVGLSRKIEQEMIINTFEEDNFRAKE